jgi:plastocyanin
VDRAVKVKLYFEDDKEKSEFIKAKEKEYDDTFYTTGQYKYWNKAVYE